MQKTGFDTTKYLKSQTRKIKERLSKFDNKLYLEFGGKLLYDGHAVRVLPGYEPDAKTQLLKKLKDLEIIYCVGAKDVQKGRIRHDFGLTYDLQTIKEVSEIRQKGLKVVGIVITRYEGESLALRLKRKLENAGNKVYFHTEIKDYPDNMRTLLGKEGFAKQPFVKTKAPLIVVTGAGGGSGKMSVCLSQLFHEQKRDVNAGYAKFETFPIWNLPLKHLVNTAYEAATADLGDYNVIDPFHLKKYGKRTVNYNRDVENFIILKRIMKTITKKGNYINNYFSPTDMGVNMAKQGIVDEKIIKKCAKEEIIRRYFRYKQEYILGIEEKSTTDYMDKIMEKAKVSEKDYLVVKEARIARLDAKNKGKGNKGVFTGAAIELPDGTILKAHNSKLLHAGAAIIIKALKEISGISKSRKLLPKKIINQMIKYKKIIGKPAVSLNAQEVITLLAITALYDSKVKGVLVNLSKLNNLNVHLTHIPKHGDEAGLKKLGLNITTDSELGLQSYSLLGT